MTSTRLRKLIEGYQEFRSHYFEGEHSLYERLTKYGQKPDTLVIACSDSRVDPAIVTNCEPGDLFVVRNVANLVPPYEHDDGYHGTSAAVEFAVNNLGVSNIIVFGHTQCGGIRALLEMQQEPGDPKSFITKWMRLAGPACQLTMELHREESLEEQVRCCSQYALIHSLMNLKSFPWVQQRIKAGVLFLHAWYFDLSTGIICAFDEKQNRFIDLT